MNVVGVTIDEKNILYFNSNGFNVKRNIAVIVETDRGLQFGQVVFPNFERKEKIENRIIRIATKKDYSKNLKNIEEAKEAFEKCKNLIKKYKLSMKLLDCSFTFDKTQLLFRFISETRVDFRELAKELANFYKTRIELRQIGIRDKAKEIGGYGVCGQKLCCSRFSTDFSSVSINMAKNQNISLNPSKINGVCGRLLCCLKYEDGDYKECRSNSPKIGSVIETKNGTGKVLSVDLLKGICKVLVGNEVIEMSINCGCSK